MHEGSTKERQRRDKTGKKGSNSTKHDYIITYTSQNFMDCLTMCNQKKGGKYIAQ